MGLNGTAKGLLRVFGLALSSGEKRAGIIKNISLKINRYKGLYFLHERMFIPEMQVLARLSGLELYISNNYRLFLSLGAPAFDPGDPLVCPCVTHYVLFDI